MEIQNNIASRRSHIIYNSDFARLDSIAGASGNSYRFAINAIDNRISDANLYKGFIEYPPTMAKALHETISQIPDRMRKQLFSNLDAFFKSGTPKASLLKDFLINQPMANIMRGPNKAVFDHYMRLLAILAKENGFDLKHFLKR